MPFARLFGVIAALAMARAAPASDVYSCQTLDVPGASSTQLWRLNNAGQVAADTNLGGYIYESATGVWTPLPAPPSSAGIPAADIGPEDINDHGVIVGAAGVNTNEPFILSALTGTYQFVAPPSDPSDPYTSAEFRAIGDNGLLTAIAYGNATGYTSGFI